MDEPPAPPLISPPPSELAPPPARTGRPPVWPILLVLVVGPIASLLVSSTVVTLLALARNPHVRQGDIQAEVAVWIEENVGELRAILALLVPGQLTLLTLAIVAVALSRERPLERLGFVGGNASLGVVVLAVLGGLGVQFAIDLVAGWLIEEPSNSLKILGRMFLEPQGVAAVVVGFSMSVLPGVCEEAFFRGFGLRGLLRRWSPLLAILVSSVIFALAHFDVQHSPAVFPLGVWFGFVAWRTGSLWPAIACHFANNISAYLVVRVWGDAETFDVPDGVGFFGTGAVLLACTILATIVLMRRKPGAG